MTASPLIIAYFDGDDEVRILSNFAVTPFFLDDIEYKTVEGFWQSLKTNDPILREKFRYLDGQDAKQLGKRIASATGLFVYQQNLYRVGSRDHHMLLERALRAKTAQNADVKTMLLATDNRPLKHLLKNRFGVWRSGDSPALPAIIFERMWTTIRVELQTNNFNALLPLPEGVSLYDSEDGYFGPPNERTID